MDWGSLMLMPLTRGPRYTAAEYAAIVRRQLLVPSLSFYILSVPDWWNQGHLRPGSRGGEITPKGHLVSMVPIKHRSGSRLVRRTERN